MIISTHANSGGFMNAIEFDTIAHGGIVALPEAYRQQWSERNVRVIVMTMDELPDNQRPSLLSSLKNIKIKGPEDFAENLDAYLNGEKHA